MKDSRSRKGFKWLVVVAVLVAGAALSLALLPSVLSSQWGKGRVLGLAAPHVPGELHVDDWSLSWFGAQNISGISYRAPESGVDIRTTEVTVAKGLASFLLDRGNVGTVTVTGPDIKIQLPEAAPEETTSEPAVKTDTTRSDQAATPEPAGEGGTAAEGLTLPPISGRLVMKEGTAAIIRSGDGVEPVATDINLEIDIDALGELTYSLAMTSPDAAGSISGNGTLTLQQAATVLASFSPAGDLRIKNWDISQILELASAYGAIPEGTGIIDSTISFDGTAGERISLEGGIDLSNLELWGGPFNNDRPQLENTSLVFVASAGQDGLDLSSLDLKSPLASGSLAANVDASGALQFETDLNIDLQEVATQIPDTLNLQEGLQITEGTLQLNARVDSAQGVNRFLADAQVDGLAGIRATRKISLDEPFTMSVKGQRGTEGLRLETFSVQSSFLQGEGRGDLNDLQLSLNADLGAALAEISKFISLGDYQAGGRLGASIKALRKDDAIVSLTARIDADDLVVQRGKTLIIPRKPLKLSVDSDLLMSRDFSFTGVAEGNVSYQAWFGKGSLTGRELVVGSDQQIEKIGRLEADNQLYLNDLSVLLASLGALPETVALSGGSRVQFMASGTGRKLKVENVFIDSPKLLVRKGADQLIPESGLTIKGSSEFVMDDSGGLVNVNKPDFSYQSWLGSGTVQAETVDAAKGHVNALAFAGKTDLAKLAELLGGLEILPADMTFSGVENSSLKMDYTPEKIDLESQHTEIKDFVLTQEGKTYRDKKLVIDASGTIDMVNKGVAFSPLHIDSANGAVSFEQLVVGDWESLIDTLTSAGQARFDLTTLFGAVADWFSLPPDVSAAAMVDLNWSAEARKGEEHSYRFAADLDKFSLGKAGVQAFTGEKAALQIDGLRNPANGSLTLRQFNLSSPFIDFDAAGFRNLDRDQNADFSLKGDLAMDLARVAALVRTFSELDLEMAGKSKRPFELKGKISPAQQEKWWQHTDFKGSFQADLIRMLGVELRSLQIPIVVTNGQAQAEVKGSANEGELLLKPHLDMMSYPPILTIPDNSQILNKMQITRDMANQLLARIHPLFMGASQMSGFVDLHLEHFRWPLGKDTLDELQFAGFMDFHDVRLDSSAMLGSLLQVLRVEETGLDLSGRQVRFACKDGRIETNPLRTNLSDTELVISGSLGLDTTIDYLAQAEVTERLVGGDLYDYLEGTTINVPIGGTLSNPDISAETVQRAVTDLINQAGQKKLQEAAGSLLKRLF